MKNDDIYKTLSDRIAGFKEYCSMQKECPCKFNNENCEFKWLDSECVSVETNEDSKYLDKIKKILNENKWYVVIWQGSSIRQVMINRLPNDSNKEPLVYRTIHEEYYDKYDDEVIYSFEFDEESLTFKKIYDTLIDFIDFLNIKQKEVKK
jgi:hypothetical protein